MFYQLCFSFTIHLLFEIARTTSGCRSLSAVILSLTGSAFLYTSCKTSSQTFIIYLFEQIHSPSDVLSQVTGITFEEGKDGASTQVKLRD